jgi:hypothetical protein
MRKDLENPRLCTLSSSIQTILLAPEFHRISRLSAPGQPERVADYTASEEFHLALKICVIQLRSL